MRLTVLFIAIALTANAGCSYYTNYITAENSQKFEQVNPKEVKIYSNMPTNVNKYEVIGLVACDVLGDSDYALVKLKEEAASIGANAIINIKLSKIGSYMEQRVGMNGTAVRIIE